MSWKERYLTNYRLIKTHELVRMTTARYHGGLHLNLTRDSQLSLHLHDGHKDIWECVAAVLEVKRHLTTIQLILTSATMTIYGRHGNEDICLKFI
jgi:hypothetical protein